MSFVTLLLDVVPMDAAVKHGPDIQVEGAQIYYGKREKFLFDADRNNRKEITVAGRCFVVTLLQINKLQIANVANPIEYVFGISEK